MTEQYNGSTRSTDKLFQFDRTKFSSLIRRQQLQRLDVNAESSAHFVLLRHLWFLFRLLFLHVLLLLLLQVLLQQLLSWIPEDIDRLRPIGSFSLRVDRTETHRFFSFRKKIPFGNSPTSRLDIETRIDEIWATFNKSECFVRRTRQNRRCCSSCFDVRSTNEKARRWRSERIAYCFELIGLVDDQSAGADCSFRHRDCASRRKDLFGLSYLIER